MPEPNLPPLYLHNLIDVASLREQLPELPEQMRQKTFQDLTPQAFVAITVTFVILDIIKMIVYSSIFYFQSDLELFKLFRNILENGKYRNPQLVATIVISEITTFLQANNLQLTYW